MRFRDFQGLEGSDFFTEDRGFQTVLEELLTEQQRETIFDSLHQCARLVSGPWDELAREASRSENLPRIVKYDRTGNPVERVEFGALTRRLRKEVVEFGLFTRTSSDLHRFAIIYYLAHNGEGSLTCGISCTDGLIRAIEAKGSDFLRDTYLPLLRSVGTPLAGAQFVTEQVGGSDVGAIEAEATRNPDGTWSITGEKWFCSNPDEFYLVAARPRAGAEGTKGVAIFLVPRLLPDGSLNSLSFKRLKDKLGTRSLPTAEIDFNAATGYSIGEPGEGFKTLMNWIINTSRIHNAVNACGFLHRAFIEARNYTRQREAFGAPLIQYPLIQETLLTLLERLWRHRLLTFRLIALVDQQGLEPEDRDQAMWQRFLINLAKYRTSADLTDSVREAILLMGANGVVEDFSVLPRLLRDSMVIETWEGPHNTLCLQIIRDASRSKVVERWSSEVNASLERWPKELLSHTRRRLSVMFHQTEEMLSENRLDDPVWANTHARRIVDRLATVLEMVWLAEAAARKAEEDSTIALLTSLAGSHTLPGENQFEHPFQISRSEVAMKLIDEEAGNV